MKINFNKYQATGNDFVLLDNRAGNFNGLTKGQIAQLCDRRFGIGADGLIMLNDHPDYDFEMKYFNADGAPGSMCGNGGRSIAAFARQCGIDKKELTFLAYDGVHHAKLEGEIVSLAMNPVSGITQHGEDKILNTGSPHYVRKVEGLGDLDVFAEGKRLRNSAAFSKEGINVNFVEKISSTKIFVRTYERGVEDETYSCGTGVTASAIASGNDEDGEKCIEIKTKGGDLQVKYKKEGSHYKDIWLTGPATFVYAGVIEM